MTIYVQGRQCIKNSIFLARHGELPLINVRSAIRTRSSCLDSETNHKIPKIIYTTWARPAVPRSIARQWRKMAELNPNYQILFFDDQDVNAFMKKEWGSHPIINTYSAACFPQIKADIWRYCILYSRGGVYLDFKSFINTALDKIVNPNDLVLLGREANLVRDHDLRSQLLKLPIELRTEHWVLNWLLCSTSEQELFKLMIDRIVQLTPIMMNTSFACPKQAILEFTGPVGLTKAYLSCVQSRSDISGIRLSGIDFNGQADYILSHGRMLEYTRPTPSQHYSMARERPLLIPQLLDQ